MSLKPLSPRAVRQYLDQGAVLVDIRCADEHARVLMKMPWNQRALTASMPPD